MQTENILMTLCKGLPGSIRETLENLIEYGAAKALLESGLHYSDPDRMVNCPLQKATGSPILILEGFRKGRYVLSALFNERNYEVITSIECTLPPITCIVKQGVPRMIKSPIALPLELLRKMGDVAIVSDGSSLFSKKTLRSVDSKGLLNMQIRDVRQLEALISGI